MRARTSALVTLAAAAVALGVAVPALAMSGTARTRERPRGRPRIRAVRRRLEPPADHDPRHTERPARHRPPHPQLRHAAGRRVRRGRLDHAGRRRRTRRPCPLRPTPAPTSRPTRPPTTSSPPSTRPNAAGATTCCAPSSRPCRTVRPSRTASPSGRPPRRRSLTLRAADGSTAAPPPSRRGTQPGDYRPTPPKFAAPMYTGWGSVTPFVLDSGQPVPAAAHPAGDRGRVRVGPRRGREPRPGLQHHPHRGPDRGRQVLECLADLEHLEPGRPAARDRPASASLADATRAFAALDLVAGRHDHRPVRREVHRPRLAAGHGHPGGRAGPRG